MSVFALRMSKNKAQDIVTLKNVDSFDLAGSTTIIANTYIILTDPVIKAYTLTTQERDDFIANDVVDVAVSDLIGTSPIDAFYSTILDVDTATHESTDGGVSITLEATNETYSKQSVVDVESPDFFVEQAVHVCKMILDEMNALEDLDSSQRKDQFDRRLVNLKQILRYS